jgi:hypothetical protein
MGRGRDRIVSDPKKSEPEEDLLEFLGGIDEDNEDDVRDENFSDFLADADIERIAVAAKPPKAPPPKDEKNE